MKKKKINWAYYIVELLVVFIGVTAGFLLNNWREHKAEIRLEQKYLSSFYNDIVSDESTLDSLVFRTQKKVDNLMDILRKTEIINEPMSEDLANSIVLELLYFEWFSPTNDTYYDIINSGNLNLISDYELKEKVSSYYSFLNEVKNVEQFYKNHLKDYGFPILYKNYHLFKLKFVNDECYKSLEFTNMFLAGMSLYQQNLKMYEQALEINLELKAELSKVIIIKTNK